VIESDAQEIVLVGDSSRFQRQVLMRVCGLDAVHHIVTDRGLPAAVLRALRRRSNWITVV